MNAKQAEERSGITRRNLRFYEQQGLIHPGRNPENDYRDYSEEDIEVLKQIRALRMLDVTLEDIDSVLKEKKSLKNVMAAQEEKLKKRQKELDTAIRFCRELQGQKTDIDQLLARMDQPETRQSLFTSWLRDYQMVARAEVKKRFSFNADKEITNPQRFTMALFAYGEREHKDIVITKEGMHPEFTIDGIEYTAEMQCYYMDHNCPSDVIICEAVHPEDFDGDVEEGRGRYMRFFCHWWWVLPLLIPEIICSFAIWFGDEWEGAQILRIILTLLPLATVFAWLMILEHVIYPRKKRNQK